MKKIIFLLVLSFSTNSAFAQETIVFTGIPEIKISEGGIERTPENLSSDRALGYKCTITKIDGKYFWTTRENIELINISSGAYITFMALNGSGYVRIINPEMKSAVSIMGGTEKKFDYIEHLLIGLKSVTYYGKIK
ncbi:MAG: hypothetical protein HQK79_22885 [Desulfobacterales bacterium]|nr:hypothetical protein [Desulfobacterales bacterium]